MTLFKLLDMRHLYGHHFKNYNYPEGYTELEAVAKEINTYLTCHFIDTYVNHVLDLILDSSSYITLDIIRRTEKLRDDRPDLVDTLIMLKFEHDLLK